MQNRHAVLLVTLLALTASCRGLPFGKHTPPPTPLATDEPLHQLRFDCDFRLPENFAPVEELQKERDVIYSTLALPPSEEPIYVHLFRNEQSYQEHLRRRFPMVPNRRAFFVEVDGMLHVYAQLSDRWPEDLRHEVGHGYLHASVPAIPLWIDEGLAEYFEVPTNFNGFNRPHVLLLADLVEHNGWKPNLKALEGLQSAGEMEQQHYAEAWAWAYFFLNTTPERRELLTSYLAELRDKGKAAPISTRLATQQIDAEGTLADFILTLQAEDAERHASLRKTSP